MAVLTRALSFAALVLAMRRTARHCSHLAFHLVFKDAARQAAGGRGSADAATRIFGAGEGGPQGIIFVPVTFG